MTEHAESELLLTAVSYDKTTKQYTVKVSTGDVDLVAGVTSDVTKEFSGEKREFPANTYLPFFCSSFISPTGKSLCVSTFRAYHKVETISQQPNFFTTVTKINPNFFPTVTKRQK